MIAILSGGVGRPVRQGSQLPVRGCPGTIVGEAVGDRFVGAPAKRLSAWHRCPSQTSSALDLLREVRLKSLARP